MNSSEWVLDAPPSKADLRLPYAPGELRFGDLRVPKGKGPHPVVTVIHGGFWRARYDLEHVGHLCADLTARGYATWSLEYRRIGNPGGAYPGTLEDVGLGLDFLRTLAKAHPLDLGRVAVLGHSAGGHLAAWLAGRPKVKDPVLRGKDPFVPRGVVSLAGVLDLAHGYSLRLSHGAVEELLGGSPQKVPERYAIASPSALLPLGVRQWLLHGTKDEVVPPAVSSDYAAEAKKRGDDATFVPLEGAEHFELIDPKSKEWPRVVEAIGKAIGPA